MVWCVDSKNENKIKSSKRTDVSLVNGKWKVKMPHLMELWRRVEDIKEDEDNFKGATGLMLSYVPREQNGEADALANTAITVGSQIGEGVNVYATGRKVEGAGGDRVVHSFGDFFFLKFLT